MSRGSLTISSRKTVPPAACSSSPGLRATAPEGAALGAVDGGRAASDEGVVADAAVTAAAPAATRTAGAEATSSAEATSGARATWRWATDVPIPTYTMVVGASRLAVGEVGPAACDRAPATPERCVAVSYWVFPQDSATGARVFARADEMVEIFTDLIAPFPY